MQINPVYTRKFPVANRIRYIEFGAVLMWLARYIFRWLVSLLSLANDEYVEWNEKCFKNIYKG